MNETHISTIASALGLQPSQVRNTAQLLAEEATVPFIARYRKEATGSLDEVVIADIRDRLETLAAIDKRREAVLKSLGDSGHLTDAIRERLESASSLVEIEDIYLPYRPKRRTRATIAREKGLDPLAQMLMAQEKGLDPLAAAQAFIHPEAGVNDADEALAGARDILAETISEDAEARSRIRRLFQEKAIVESTVIKEKETEGATYRDYFDWKEPVATIASHRMLAIRRGEKEDILSVSIRPDESEAISILESLFVRTDGLSADQLRQAIKDGYKRLLSRSIETEIRLWAKDRADTEAIRVFSENLQHLLMSPPLGAKRVLAIDPGFRTGCKVACLDRQGKPLHHETVFPTGSAKQAEDAGARIRRMVQDFGIEAIAIGNGTAGKETLAFVRSLDLGKEIPAVLVNESGASIYSASEVAREEFPDLDLTVRGSISIGRRLMDPLAELVKIDPKSIGVGQYQHDVDPDRMKQALDDVVIRCVNRVGVDVNRASVQLLTMVSGIGPRLARNMVAYRNENGPFSSREALKKVPRLGEKAFEQAAGFLRIPDSAHPLDASAVHPERYAIVEAMARKVGATLPELMKHPEHRSRIRISEFVSESVGLPTLNDILEELAKPGRDPRDRFEAVEFAAGIDSIGDLLPGMRLNGVVTNVTAFGAFVDIGVHQDGLVHISELADRFIRHPSEVVHVQQPVKVTVLAVDTERRRISLSMKTLAAPTPEGPPAEKQPMEQRREEKYPDRKKAGKPQKPLASKPVPFNNPFAEAFRNTLKSS
ncbi:Tex family protein [Desulfatirhabdium butyrativorans]|uniref:Tex family protein n=1 Tax=Desulfatirhabdium butyrativorans TaxID=340467 RepID=UPI00040CFC53|nr:Tex family protein [Desulfatirhabdium butyrativorans]